jgi:hypothetical protein
MDHAVAVRELERPGENAPFTWTTSRSERPRTYSMTMKYVPRS